MILTIEQAYLASFYFLDRYWKKTQIDSLAMLLGAMNPFLWEGDVRSADPAYWEDWLLCKNRITRSDELSSEETFKVMIQFLENHPFKFELQPVLDMLKGTTDIYWNTRLEWDKSVQQASTVTI